MLKNSKFADLPALQKSCNNIVKGIERANGQSTSQLSEKQGGFKAAPIGQEQEKLDLFVVAVQEKHEYTEKRMELKQILESIAADGVMVTEQQAFDLASNIGLLNRIEGLDKRFIKKSLGIS